MRNWQLPLSHLGAYAQSQLKLFMVSLLARMMQQR
jgi:hypothetical protein